MFHVEQRRVVHNRYSPDWLAWVNSSLLNPAFCFAKPLIRRSYRYRCARVYNRIRVVCVSIIRREGSRKQKAGVAYSAVIVYSVDILVLYLYSLEVYWSMQAREN